MDEEKSDDLNNSDLNKDDSDNSGENTDNSGENTDNSGENTDNSGENTDLNKDATIENKKGSNKELFNSVSLEKKKGNERKSSVSLFLVLVFVILIVSVATFFSLFFLWPLMTENMGLEDGGDRVINTTGGFTIYNHKTKVACVQVLGLEDGLGFKIIFNIDGKNLISVLDVGDSPSEGEKVTRCFNLNEYGVPDNVVVKSIEALSENSSITYSGVLEDMKNSSLIFIPDFEKSKDL